MFSRVESVFSASSLAPNKQTESYCLTVAWQTLEVTAKPIVACHHFRNTHHSLQLHVPQLIVCEASFVSRSLSHTPALTNSFQTATQQLNVIALSSSLGIMSKEKSAVGLFFWLDGHTSRKINRASVFLWNPIFHYVLFDTARAAVIRIGPL